MRLFNKLRRRKAKEPTWTVRCRNCGNVTRCTAKGHEGIGWCHLFEDFVNVEEGGCAF